MSASDSESTSIQLAQSPQGAIYYCFCCQRLRLDYKNISLTYSWERLRSFAQILEEKYLESALNTDRRAPIIYLQLTSIALRFSFSEIEELLELITKAQIEMQRIQLEKIFHQDSSSLFAP